MININIVDDRISGSVNGKPFSTDYTEKKWKEMVALQEKEQEAETIKEAKALWSKVEKLVTTTADEQAKTISPYLTVNEKTSRYHLIEDNKVCPIPLPTSLVEKLLYAADKNLPVDPIIKFFLRTLRNPNIIEKGKEEAEQFLKEVCDYATQTFVSPVLLEKYTEEGFSEEVAREMATVQQTPITLEGLLCTKKVVTPLNEKTMYRWVLDKEGNKKKVLRDGFKQTIDEDTGETNINEPEYNEDWVFEPVCMGSRGDAFHCGEAKDSPKGHVIRVGQEMWLENWSQVNCDPEHSCSKGIHTGNQDYIDSWENERNVTLEGLVDPQYVGAVPRYDVSGVLRVKHLMPISVKDRLEANRNLYHSSTYAKLNDERYKEYREEIVKRYNDELEKAKKEAKSKLDIIPQV